MDEKQNTTAQIRLEVIRNGRTAYMLGCPGFGSIEVGIGAAKSKHSSPIFLGVTVHHDEDESWQWANTETLKVGEEITIRVLGEGPLPQPLPYGYDSTKQS